MGICQSSTVFASSSEEQRAAAAQPRADEREPEEVELTFEEDCNDPRTCAYLGTASAGLAAPFWAFF